MLLIVVCYREGFYVGTALGTSNLFCLVQCLLLKTGWQHLLLRHELNQIIRPLLLVRRQAFLI